MIIGRRKRGGTLPVLKYRALRALLESLPGDGVMSYREMERVMSNGSGASISYVRDIIHELILLAVCERVRYGWHRIDRDKLKKYLEQFERELRRRGVG